MTFFNQNVGMRLHNLQPLKDPAPSTSQPFQPSSPTLPQNNQSSGMANIRNNAVESQLRSTLAKPQENSALNAAQNGDLPQLKALQKAYGSKLLACPSPEDGNTPLHLAAKGGHADVVKWLLDQKGVKEQINTPNKTSGSTALHMAAVGSSDDAIARLLLEKGANAHAEDNNGGRTPLHTCAQWGNSSMAKLLLEEHGADIKKTTNYGSNVLHLAAQEGNAEIAKLFLSKGADMHQLEGDDCPPITVAAWKGHHDVVMLFAEELKKAGEKGIETLNRSSAEEGQTARHYATCHGDSVAVTTLLEAGADAGKMEKNGFTPLQMAAIQGQGGVIESLSQHIGKDGINTPTAETGLTALHLAAHFGQDKAVDTLLKAGADPNLKTSLGDTSLGQAARNGQSSAVQRLLQDGKVIGNINSTNNFGENVLHLAARDGRTDFHPLLAAGADPGVKGSEGLPPYQ